MIPGRPGRKLAAVVGVALVVTSLAGCATLSYEEAMVAEHRVVETGSDFLAGRDWAYINADGEQVPLTEDCKEGFFEQRCYGTPDGSVQFRFSRDKYGTFLSESITVEGEKFDADCLTEPGWSNVYICAPEPTV